MLRNVSLQIHRYSGLVTMVFPVRRGRSPAASSCSAAPIDRVAQPRPVRAPTTATTAAGRAWRRSQSWSAAHPDAPGPKLSAAPGRAAARSPCLSRRSPDAQAPASTRFSSTRVTGATIGARSRRSRDCAAALRQGRGRPSLRSRRGHSRPLVPRAWLRSPGSCPRSSGST